MTPSGKGGCATVWRSATDATAATLRTMRRRSATCPASVFVLDIVPATDMTVILRVGVLSNEGRIPGTPRRVITAMIWDNGSRARHMSPRSLVSLLPSLCRTIIRRGKHLGNPKLSDARRHAATARKFLPVIREIQGSGVKSLRGIARSLAARGIPTARGGMWRAVQVSDILRRMGWIGRSERHVSAQAEELGGAECQGSGKKYKKCCMNR